MASLRHNVVVRKSMVLAQRLPRAIRRLVGGKDAYRTHPPIIVNSFPKSGTHLLLQIAESLPGTRNYGSFIATQPVLPYIERSPAQHRRMIGRIAPGEIVATHLFHTDAIEAQLAELNAVHLFIYRDLRDVVVSEAHYLTRMNRFHRMHGYFASRLATMEERIMAAIRGVPAGAWPHAYPDIAARFRDYAPWRERAGIAAVRYEDLIGPGRDDAMDGITARFLAAAGATMRAEALRSSMIAAIQPEKSRTFREGKAGGWRDQFTPAHVDAMKAVAGDLLVELGYERDLNW